VYREPRKKSCVCINITYNYVYKIMVQNRDILLIFSVFKHIRDQFLYSIYILINPIL
jgi:hypothetical protein